MLLDAILPHDEAQGRVEIGHRKMVVEGAEHQLDKTVGDAQLDELAHEQRVVVLECGRDGRGGDEARGFVEGDVALGVDCAAAEGDRRDVPLAGGAEAKDEPPRILGDARLVRMPDD